MNVAQCKVTARTASTLITRDWQKEALSSVINMTASYGFLYKNFIIKTSVCCIPYGVGRLTIYAPRLWTWFMFLTVNCYFSLYVILLHYHVLYSFYLLSAFGVSQYLLLPQTHFTMAYARSIFHHRSTLPWHMLDPFSTTDPFYHGIC